ncbi:MAG: YfhO family protein, partial [Thermoanaerobaculia bacterium]
MLEVAVAALVPAAVAVAAARWLGDAATWRATTRWLVPIVVLWLAPCWLTGRSPVAYGFLHASIAPWTADAVDEPRGSTQLSDVPMQFAPWRETVTRRWRAGELPLLDRHAGAGSTLWANPQALVLHPLTLTGLLFSTFAWFVFVASAKLLAGTIGMFVFLRREEASEAAATFGAIAYGLSAFSIAWLLFPHTNVTMLLPWLLVAIRGVVAGGSRKSAGAGAIVLALMCAGGHPESVAHSAFVALPYAGWLLLQTGAAERRRALVRLAALGVVGLLLAAPLLVPFAISLPECERMVRWERMPRFWTAPSLTLENLLPFVSGTPALFGSERADFNEIGTQYAGLLAFVLAFWRATRAPKREGLWIGLFVACAILAFDWPGSRWLESIPIAGHMLHGRLRFVMVFVVALLAARAVDDAASETKREGLIASAVVCALASLLGTAVAMDEMVARGFGTEATVATGIATLATLAGLLLLARSAELFRAAAPLLLAADLFASLWLFNAPVSRRLDYPPMPGLEALARERGPARVAGVDNALLANSAAMIGVEEIGAHDPMAWEPYIALLRRAGYDTTGYFAQWRQLPPKLLLDYLGVTTLVAPPGIRIAGLDIAYSGADLTIYRNRGAQPRAFVPTAVVESSDPLESFTRSADARAVAIEEGEGGARVSP